MFYLLFLCPTGLAPQPDSFVQSLRKLPIFHDEQYAQQTFMYDYYGEDTLVLP